LRHNLNEWIWKLQDFLNILFCFGTYYATNIIDF
jgi:hypothetical protein